LKLQTSNSPRPPPLRRQKALPPPPILFALVAGPPHRHPRISTNQDANTISEKWEALGLIPLKDAANPDDFLLLVGNDNNFKANVVIHNDVPVGTNDVPSTTCSSLTGSR
jgi:hypothetical protein